MNNKNREQAVFVSRGFAGRIGFGRWPAILVIDVIYAFTETASPLAADLRSQIQAISKLLGTARSRKVPVIFTTVEYDPSLRDAGLFTQKVKGMSLLVEGSHWVELHSAMKRKKGELLLKKKYASAFFGTGLASILSTFRVDTLIVTGCTTSGCVRATVVDALQYGLHAIIPRETVGDRSESAHKASLSDMDLKYGDVVSLKEALNYLRKLTNDSHTAI